MQHNTRQNIDKHLTTILEVLNSGTAARHYLVQKASNSAARIFEISQQVRSNQDVLMEFAEESCRLAYDISLKLMDKREIEQSLTANLEEFLETLQLIRKFGEKCAARSTIKAVLLHGFGFDNKVLKAQRRKLERCMLLFGFRSLLELREITDRLVEQQVKNGGVSNTTTNGNNTTENKTSPENNANFGGANDNVMPSGNAIDYTNNNHGGGAGQSSTDTEYTNNLVNTISFGSGANFSNSTANAFGANNEVNYNSNNLYNSNSAPNDNSENRSDSHGNSGNARNNHQRTSTANVNETNIGFGDSANFTGANGNVFGSNNQTSHNSNNVHDNSTKIHNNGSHNVTVSHQGNNNKTHIGDNNANNQGVIGGGSNNTVNSGSNSSQQLFSHANNLTFTGGEFSAVGGNITKNTYMV